MSDRHFAHNPFRPLAIFKSKRMTKSKHGQLPAHKDQETYPKLKSKPKYEFAAKQGLSKCPLIISLFKKYSAKLPIHNCWCFQYPFLRFSQLHRRKVAIRSLRIRQFEKQTDHRSLVDFWKEKSPHCGPNSHNTISKIIFNRVMFKFQCPNINSIVIKN